MLYVSGESINLHLKIILNCILTNWNVNKNLGKNPYCSWEKIILYARDIYN